MFRVLGTSSAKILASSQAHGHGMRANLSGSAVLQNKVGGGKKGKGGAAVTKKKVRLAFPADLNTGNLIDFFLLRDPGIRCGDRH